MLRIAFALAVTSLVATPVMAAPCKDAKGKFIKCPTTVATAPAAKAMVAAKATTKTTKVVATGKKAPCRDAKGRFKKC
jgi:hypothetical protein